MCVPANRALGSCGAQSLRKRTSWPERTMNASDRHSRYKGLNVTVRWQMVYGKSSLAPLFNTSYSIAEMDDEPPHWHYFPDRLFHSKEYAAAFALREARWLIDRRA